MTTHKDNTFKADLRRFVSAKEAQREPRPEQTDAEIREWVKAQIRADKKTLDLLATL